MAVFQRDLIRNEADLQESRHEHRACNTHTYSEKSKRYQSREISSIEPIVAVGWHCSSSRLSASSRQDIHGMANSRKRSKRFKAAVYSIRHFVSFSRLKREREREWKTKCTLINLRRLLPAHRLTVDLYHEGSCHICHLSLWRFIPSSRFLPLYFSVRMYTKSLQSGLSRVYFFFLWKQLAR